MLKCIDLHKTYKPKKGVPVKALDGISLTFPDTGMIFLLGKSGSGKSTLLNVLGGLDRYDSGDIIVRGTSTKDFKQSHFDSYRNTYIGFIFQEYNILEEFTVGANIALAIELQNRSATDEEINRILKEVDLEGYGQRRPNELSGGQKQRVAIARALVKNPEIIFADEPTGALDSKTGKQVFDTLKKLSADHLVVVVSHDRDFAEGYADRIIELSDGRVIDDVEVVNNEVSETETTEETEGLTFDGATISVPAGYHLTEEDRVMINAYLEDQAKTIEIKGKQGIKRKEFTATDEEKIVSQKNTGFHLIKSKLPFKIAFRIGARVLKHKKVRLVFTILLSLVSFTLFALANTFATYDHVRACTDSIIDSNITYASVTRRPKNGSKYYGGYYANEYDFTKDEIKKLSEETGLNFTGKYQPDNDGSLDFSSIVG
ncbi:MAG: ABC transporter ATP-binding protein, partial [Clostridia bacterium]|nr:ABC transporter ATP-binding protein [Clostridia bacterium]